LNFGHLELIRHPIVRSRREPGTNDNGRISAFSKWPVLARPSLAGFARPMTAEFSGEIEELRRRALQLGSGARFLIDISKYEYVQQKEEHDFEGFRIFVYSPAMIVCEKLRAICQQMPEYAPVVKRTQRPGSPRARDFLDIYAVITHAHVVMTSPENRKLLAQIFEAKKVPLQLLNSIEQQREFHRSDFLAVVQTVKAGVALEEFDFYFDFVLNLAADLKAAGDV
jgi:Nucleotidyl transferase AbiEii toxin, Type IV TA system